MQGGFLHSIAIHDILHPGGLAGAMRLPRGIGMGVPSVGGGFLGGLTGSPLGQIGLSLLAGGGGSLGNTAAMLMQQGMMQRLYGARSGPQVEHIGNTIGILDPQTGEFKPTYTAPAAEDEFTREMRAAGIDPASDEGQAKLKQRVDNMTDPTVTIPLGDGRTYMGPKSGMQQFMQGQQQPSPAPGALAPPNLSRAVQAAEMSRGDFNPNGSPLTSPAGAKYAMQVMPATAANPGYGVPPAANDSAAEYDRVGSDYIGKLVQHYGDVQKGLAAYNWGPDNLNRDLSANGQNWLQGAPSGVQSYVGRGMGAMGGNDVLSQAQAAIAAGADPAQVRARAQSMGVSLP